MTPIAAIVVGAEIIKAVLPLLPGIEQAFRDVWPRTESFDTAWGFLSPLIPSTLRAPLEPVIRAVWDTYDTPQLEAAWLALRGKLAGGDGIERAVAPSFEDALEDQHHRADQLEGSPTADDAPVTIPAPPEFDPPRFDDGELTTSVEVPHPHEGQS